MPNIPGTNIPAPNLSDAYTPSGMADPYYQGVRNQANINTANGGLVGIAMGRAAPYVHQQWQNDERINSARDQQLQALGLASQQADGTAPSAAAYGQQMALGQGLGAANGGMAGGNMLAMRQAMGQGYQGLGQAATQGAQARGAEQMAGMSQYGQGVNTLGQSDLAQREMALNNNYQNSELGLNQAKQNYALGSGLEGLWSEFNKQQNLQNAGMVQRENQQRFAANSQANADANAAIGTGITVGSAMLGGAM